MSNKTDALERGSSLLRAVLIIIMVLSILAMIFFGLVLELKREGSKKVLEIGEENREYVRSLVPTEMAEQDDFKNFEDAVSVTTHRTLDDTDLVIHYRDGSKCTYIYVLANDSSLVLARYIRENGYNAYLHSGEFTLDLLKLCVPLAVVVASGVFLKKSKQKSKLRARNEE